MKKFILLLILSIIPSFIHADVTDVSATVKPLLIRGIEMYIDKRYELAIRYFQEVQKLEPKNELAQQYIDGSRQRLSEEETAREIEEKNKDLDKK